MTLGCIKGTTSDVNVQDVQIPSIRERRSEELVLAVIGPVGSGCSRVVQILKELRNDQPDDGRLREK